MVCRWLTLTLMEFLWRKTTLMGNLVCASISLLAILSVPPPVEGDAPGNKGVMSSSSGVRSKWELVDYGDDSSEEEEEK